MKDFIGGAIAALVGIGFAAYAFSTLDLGTFRRMGPGLFPVIVGAALLLLGLGQMLVSRRAALPAGTDEGSVDTARDGHFRLGQVAWVLAAVLAFGLSVRSLGLLPAILISVMLSTQADRATRPLTALLLAIGLCLFCWLVFDVALRLPIPLLRLPF